MQNDSRHYSIMVKPVGSLCNLRCSYCYYLGKGCGTEKKIMDDSVLENYIRQVVEVHGQDSLIEFAWHGGEPLLAGMEFYRKALAYQAKYAAGRQILNTLQTNGTLLDDEWCSFFRTNGFRIGISIDGPEHIHNIYRKDSQGRGTFQKVMKGLDLLIKHGVEYNVLTTVNADNSLCGKQVYSFLRSISDYMQFLPVVESVSEDNVISIPPGIYSPQMKAPHAVAPFTVSGDGYGKFLCDVFDMWLTEDVGKKFVQIFEATIGNITRRPAGLCVNEAVCGHCAIVERNGDLYRCDRYVFDEYRIGNICDSGLYAMMESNRDFGEYKLESLPHRCLHCDVVELCFGGCPKDRLLEQLTLYGVDRYNWLCSGYRSFYRHFKENFFRLQC